MKRALRKVANVGKAPRVNLEFVDETASPADTESEPDEIESDDEDAERLEPWEPVVKERRYFGW